jgi:hypothetical protein
VGERWMGDRATTYAESVYCPAFYAAEARERWPLCPPHFIQSLELYVNAGLKPGHFLTAVLENNLQEAVGHAHDNTVLVALPEIVGVVYNELTDRAWGDKEKVAAWLAGASEWLTRQREARNG